MKALPDVRRSAPEFNIRGAPAKELVSAVKFETPDTVKSRSVGLLHRKAIEVNIGFFFVDIIGLSNPSLSVTKQIQKIESLNKLIDSCEAYKTPREKKIVLPTGDGMAIGFLLNPELPLQLAIQLHRRLKTHNSGKAEDERIAVRIGLSSGPVCIVKDMNDNDNVWGPGIILARRVMDSGDAGHILVADKTAEELIALKEDYKEYLKLVDDNFEIKHGQRIKIYSASSFDFGNAEVPKKVRKAKG